MRSRHAAILALMLLAAACDPGTGPTASAPPPASTTTSSTPPATTSTIACPCDGCGLSITLQAGDDTADAYGYSGILRSCTVAEPGVTTTVVAWDGFGFCGHDCEVTVDPGQEMTLMVQPWHPAVRVAAGIRSAWGTGASFADLEPAGDGVFRVRATQTPGDWVLTIEVLAPGLTGAFGFDVHVRHAGLDALEGARARWQAGALDRYRFTAELSSEWEDAQQIGVWVDGGRVVEGRGEDAILGLAPRLGDVAWLFDLVESIPPAYLREVAFDPTLGYPTLIVAAGAFGREWILRVEGLEATDARPPAVSAGTAPLPWMSRGHFQQVDAIVEGIVGETLGPSFDGPGWIVAFHVQDSHFPGVTYSGERGLLIVDPLVAARIPMLWGRGGERLVLFLAADSPPDLGENPNTVADYRLLWAARRTDIGLEFTGPLDAAPYLNAEVPLLCVPGAERTASSPAALAGADAQLQVLARWLGLLYQFEENHGASAPGPRAEVRLARACRDLGLSH